MEVEGSSIEEDDVLDYFMRRKEWKRKTKYLAIDSTRRSYTSSDYKKKPKKYIHVNGYFESPPPLLVLSCALSSLGGIYMDQEQYDLAMESHLKLLFAGKKIIWRC